MVKPAARFPSNENTGEPACWCPVLGYGPTGLWTGAAFAILAVNNRESKSVAWKFRNLLRVNFTLLLDTNGAAAKDWEVQIYPTSYLIDPRGDIRYVAYGAMDWDSKEVMQVIDALLNESP
jgi:peroxiredoxin